MGKAIPRSIRSKAEDLFENFPDKISVDFRKNKEFLKTLEIPYSKLQVNLISAYASRMKKKEIEAKAKLEGRDLKAKKVVKK